MLELSNIVKDYPVGDGAVHALRGVSLSFRRSEFVSILGPSGCGKTTLLNIIGGLDGYTAGDLVINGTSTKAYRDRDWDSYRNHSIGFVFQSYNLIPHQTVLSNVELALTLSGVGKHERRERAKAALVKVGLGDQLNKKPSEMSGGQMQRVAIARALVNDPDIILADEPTGALDTKTSVQVMEILKEISKEKLVVMVTHNPELAEKYSSRIIRMLDGEVVSDTMAPEEEEKELWQKEREASASSLDKKEKKPSMSFRTSFMLSLKNLFTKKTRTLLTSFAGSIGIIGIALILAVSEGVSGFIAKVQEDTLSTYPLTVQRYTQDTAAMLSALMGVSNAEDYSESGKIYVDDSLGTMMAAMNSTVENNLKAFKEYIESHSELLEGHLSDLQYIYDYDLQVYTADGKVKVGMETIFSHMGSAFSGMTEMMEMSGSSAGMSVFSEMIDNDGLLDQQYDVIAGSWPKAANEVILVVNSNNQISKMTLYMLGVLDPNDIDAEMDALEGGTYKPADIPPYEFSDFIGMTFKLLTTADFYEKSDITYTVDGTEYYTWYDLRETLGFDTEAFVKENGTELKIAGIVRPKAGTAATSISTPIGYTGALTEYILAKNEASEVINQQKEVPTHNVLTGLPFERTYYTPETIGDLVKKIDAAKMEIFYAYMTEQILNNPDFSNRINVKDTESFLGVYMLLPEKDQAEVLTRVLDAAAEADADAVDKLCAIVSMTTGGITVTRKNFAMLLPVLDEKIVMMAFVGMSQGAYTIEGLLSIAGDEAMKPIYAYMTESVMNMTVNEEIFVTILSTMAADDPAFIQLEERLYGLAPHIDASFDSVLEMLDDTDRAFPASINFFAKDFASKEAVEDFIADYNATVKEKTDEISYTDVVGALMSSVTIIVDAITYVLVAFVAISLIVSSIMIGVITLISVQERTKEIGILRAIGASKRDVSSLFNAETVIVGFAAGLLGVIVTYLLCIPINIILHKLTDIATLNAHLPIGAAAILVGISVLLTLFAGIIPSRSAAKKDPVVALRTE